MTRAMNSGESSNNCMKALACLSTLAGTISAVRSSPKEDRQAVVAPALGRQDLLQQLPLLFAGFGAIDRHEPARFVVEDLGKALGIRVAHACDDAKAFLLDGLGKLPHADSGGCLPS